MDPGILSGLEESRNIVSLLFEILEGMFGLQSLRLSGDVWQYRVQG